jgi:hypothetical protein
MYNDPACNARISPKWCPPGHASRTDYLEQQKTTVEHVEGTDEVEGGGKAADAGEKTEKPEARSLDSGSSV